MPGHASHCHALWPLFMFFHVCYQCIYLPCRVSHHIALQENGRICGVGSADGGTTILQLSKGLADIQPNEKHAIGAVRSLLCTLKV